MKGNCHVCNKPGHYKKDCWHAQKSAQSNQGREAQGSQRGFSRGRGRGFQRGAGRGRDQGHQGQGSSSDQPNFSSETWAAQVCSIQPQ